MSSKYGAIQAEYVTGTMTLRALAKAHGQSYDGLRKVAAHECWQRLRREAALQATNDARKEMAARCREWNAGDVDAAQKLRDAVQKRLENADAMTLQELREAGKTLREAQEIGRIALGVEGINLQPRAPGHSPIDFFVEQMLEGELRRELQARGLPVTLWPHVQAHLSAEDCQEVADGCGAEAVQGAVEAMLKAAAKAKQ